MNQIKTCAALALTLAMSLAVSSCRSVPVAGECPETRDIFCATPKVCAEDKARGCQKCSCEAAWEDDAVHEQDRIRGK